MPELDGVSSLHIVGAAGAGMSPLAKVLSQMGYMVTGSDLKFGEPLHELEDLGLEVWEGSRPERIAGVNLVAASSAVPEEDAELEAARRQGIEVWRRPRLLQALTDVIPTIGATGTHGKTTTSAMLVTALYAAGESPSFIVGGQLKAFGTNGVLSDRNRMVLEVDEAFGTFLDLRLTGLVVTNVEPDHLDYYETTARLEAAFADVVAATDGPVVVGVDDDGGRRLAEATGRPTYGTSSGADWLISEVEKRPDGVSFVLSGSKSAQVTVPKPGLHVARNAAGSLALTAMMGLDLEAAAAGLKNYAGVHRRYEPRGTVGGVTIIDDYAHHPTEVAATLEAAQHGNWSRVWAVFQPHRYSRTVELATELGTSLAAADRVVITDVYAAGESPIPGVTGELVAEAAEAQSRAVSYVPHRSDVAAFVADRVAPGDLVLSMGAGDISLLPDELARRLAASPQ